ncbi:hypothetical protein TKK_0010670 [Trichogramma kaykai]
MESFGLFNGPVRIKKESLDESFEENNRHEITEKTSTIQNFQIFTIKQENSTYRLTKCDETHEMEFDDIRIEIECRDEKPKLNSWLKIEDASPNYLQNMSRDWAEEKDIKKEEEAL